MIEGAQNPFFQTLVTGRFFPGNTAVQEYQPRKKDPGFRDLIMDSWEEAGSQQRGLRRTWVFRKPPEIANGNLQLSVAQSSFMEFAATRDARVRALFPRELETVDPVGTSTLIVTHDNTLLVATKVPENNGAMNVIGGYPDVPRDDSRPHIQPDINALGEWDPFRTITREIGEEAGILPHELAGLQLSGVIFSNSKRSRQPIITSVAHTALSSEEIKKRSNTGEVELRFIPNDQSVIESLLSHPDGLIRTAMANLLFHGRMQYGNDWYQKMHQVLSSESQKDSVRNQAEKDAARRLGVSLFEVVSL
jgi:hypothetical protein